MDTVFRYLFFMRKKFFKPAGLTVLLYCGTAVFISAGFSDGLSYQTAGIKRVRYQRLYFKLYLISDMAAFRL